MREPALRYAPTLTVDDLERMWRLPDDFAHPSGARLVIRRTSREDLKNGVLRVSLDDRRLGAIGYGQVLHQPIAPGPHILAVSNGWDARRLSVDVEAGRAVLVECGTGPRRWQLLTMLLRPLLGLRVWVNAG